MDNEPTNNDPPNELDSPLEEQEQPKDDFDKALPPQQASDDPGVPYSALAQYFGKDQPNQDEARQLQFLWDYFGKDTKTRGDIVSAVSEVEHSLTPPEVGQTRLNKIYAYVRVLEMVDDTEKERKAYLKRKK